MARLARVVLPGHPVHIIQRGNNRQAVFFAEEDYQKYLDTLREAAGDSGCAIHAYVLMTNHIHLLVTPEHENSLSIMMQSIGRCYVRYINSTYQRSGSLWEGRYKSSLIDSDNYLLTCSRYIELNPVRAGMVASSEDCAWSSYRRNALGYENPIIKPHPLYLKLGSSRSSRQEAYRALFSVHLDNDMLKQIRESTQKCTVMGNHRFQEEIEKMLKRRVRKYKHGGDRRSQGFRRVSSGLAP